MIENARTRRLLSLTGLMAALVSLIGLVTVIHARAEISPAAPQAVQQSTTLYLPIAYAGWPVASVDNSVFGVQMYNVTRPDSQYYPSLMQSGASWVRVALDWRVTEPENVPPAEYKWQYADRALAVAAPNAGGLRVIATIETAPAWAVADPSKPDSPINAGNIPDFLEFVAALVERFDGDGYEDAPGAPVVNHWEFYNEPDRIYNRTDGRWGLHPAEYAAMLAAVYPVVKQQNPNAQVVFGGLAYDFFVEDGGSFNRAFLDDVLAAGGGNYFDVFNFHAYPSFAYNWLPPGVTDGGPGLLEKTQYLRDKLASFGVNKPMIITEAGWHSNDDENHPGSEEIQARYVVQLFAQSLAADIDVMIWWMLYDPGDGGWDNGLVTSSNPPRHKLSFTAFQTLVNRLAARDFVRVLSDAETGSTAMEAYEFTAGATGTALYIAWLNPMETTAGASLALPGEAAATFDPYNSPGPTFTDLTDGIDDGLVHVPVGGQPLYIEVTQ